MNIFGFRPFKGKFNLGNSDDIPENQDGTLIGSIKQINNDLSVFSFRVNEGSPEFSIDGGTTWSSLGGGSVIKSVQRGSFNKSISNNTVSSGSVNITTVDPSKAFLIITCSPSTTLPSASENRMPIVTGVLNASTISYIVAGMSNSGGYTCRVDWQVVEFE